MFDMGIGDLMNNAAALKEEQDDKRIEAMLFVTDIILSWTGNELLESKYRKYMLVVHSLLENDYYNALSDVDFDVIYRLIGD